MEPEQIIAEARREGRVALDEASGKRLLASFGIAVPRHVVAQDPDDAAHKAQTLDPPLVAKVISPDILHKSDAGGVRLHLKDAAAVRDAIAAMRNIPAIWSSRVEGWLIEEMAPKGREVVIGGVRDPQFGPMIMVGLGGIFVEVLKDV